MWRSNEIKYPTSWDIVTLYPLCPLHSPLYGDWLDSYPMGALKIPGAKGALDPDNFWGDMLTEHN